MSLKKYNKKIIYDGEKILAIGKQELYPRVYKRVWDLTQYNNVEKYGLENKKYFYIGQTEQKYSSQRKQDLKAKSKKGYSINPVFQQFLINLKEFYKNELKYSDEVIEKIIIPNEEVICRCASKEMALRREKEITGYYIFLSLIYNDYKILSNRDSCLKPIHGSRSYRFV